MGNRAIRGGVIGKTLLEMPAPTKDDIERLSRGLPTRSRVGSRAVGHRLTLKERCLFDAAKRQGFLKLPVTGLRENVVNLYRLWCEVEGRPFVLTGGPPP